MALALVCKSITAKSRLGLLKAIREQWPHVLWICHRTHQANTSLTSLQNYHKNPAEHEHVAQKQMQNHDSQVTTAEFAFQYILYGGVSSYDYLVI